MKKSKSTELICSINGCEGKLREINGKKYLTRGYCNAHYRKSLKYNNPLIKIHNSQENFSKHPLYGLYCAMKKRCFNKKDSNYINYGGRGITVCDSWLGINGFKNFCNDMQDRLSNLHTLDRIDNNGNYCKENCRWATKEIQNRNQRKRKDGVSTVGIYFIPSTNKFVVKFRLDKKQKHFGTFKSIEEAENKVTKLKSIGITAFNI